MRQDIRRAIQGLSRNNPLYIFINSELEFYRQFFPQFVSKVIREKRILEFENPNRMKVTYEYDVAKLKNEIGPMFVFLPKTRKNWLRIIWEGRRLAVSSAESVSAMVLGTVEKDLQKVKEETKYNGDLKELWRDEIWPGHIPCFIDGSFIKESVEVGQLVVEYYDSFDYYEHVGHKWSLFDERRYGYDYALEAGSSHWIYVKSPDKFQVIMLCADKRVEEIKGNDPEIKAYRLFPNNDRDAIHFDIDIRVPRTLKWWYGMIVISGALFVFSFIVLSIIHIVKSRPLPVAFAQVGVSLVAAIIASRGWMMNDETILMRVSNIMTVLAVVIMVVLVIMYSL